MADAKWESAHKKWLEERKYGIGGSDAASLLGKSPYKTNLRLWEEKTGRRESPDISDKSFVQYGTQAEAPLRQIFALDYPEFKVGYEEFKIIRNPDHPFIFATLDGWLTASNGSIGVLEIKTTEILNSSQWQKWDNRIPDNYYIQVLHQMIATGYSFAYLKAQIKRRGKDGEITHTTRHYRIDRTDCKQDIDMLLREEIKFWECVESDRKPALWLPEI